MSVTNDWQSILLQIIEPYANKIDLVLSEEVSKGIQVLPPMQSIFKAYSMCPFSKIKVVIIGQDCYHTKGDAMGLCFSVEKDRKCPPSLRNIIKAIQIDCGQGPRGTDLSDLATQGVLLLNIALTVRESAPGSHLKFWKEFTKQIINYIACHKQNVCYMLWGKQAFAVGSCVDTTKNLVLTHTHPSPLSRKPFIGCKHFSQCNSYLEAHGIEKIIWIENIC